jgi:AcrR family transcriptional regulator
MSRPRLAITEQAILDGALSAFSEKGYADTSLRDVMAAAGLSTTAFYARFASKEAVLDALLARLTERLLERARAAMNEAATVEAGFENGARVLAEIVLPERAVLRLALGEGMASAGARATLRTVYATLSGLLTTRLERLMAKGAIPAVDAPALGFALAGAMQLHLVRWAVLDELSDDALAHELVRTARALVPVVRPVRADSTRADSTRT